MALPTSTIVMAVLTCIPFGLAIRDTVTHKTSVSRGDADLDDDDDDDSEAAAEYTAAEARREAEEAETERLDRRRRDQLRTARRTLFGAEVATLGTGFRGLALGMPETDLTPEQLTTLEAAAHVGIELVTHRAVDGLVIRPEGRDRDDDDETSEMCSSLGEDLRAAWGRGLTDDYERRYWRNPTTGTRASIDPEDCQLVVERAVAPTAWVTKTRASAVPVWLVGQSLAKLREHVAGRAELEELDASFRWVGLGVGAGAGETRYEAYVTRGRVVAITAVADTVSPTYDEVLEQLTKLYGQPVEQDDGLVWKRLPAIRIDTREDAGLALTIGQIPVED